MTNYYEATPTVEVVTTGTGTKVKIVHPRWKPVYIPVDKDDASKMATDIVAMLELAYQAGKEVGK